MAALSFDVQWLPAPDVRDVALARTWSAFAIKPHSGRTPLTHCLDKAAAESARMFVFGSLLPLGEWVLRHWHDLLDSRREELQEPSLRRAWRHRHAWRSGREGMAFPDLTTQATGPDRVTFRWTADAAPMLGVPIRFLDAGELETTRADAERTLIELMTNLVGRLSAIPDQRAEEFRSSWDEHVNRPHEERRYRALLARLGTGPEDTDPALAELLRTAAKRERLQPVAEALFDAADPTSLLDDQEWAERVWRLCEEAPPTPTKLKELRSGLAKLENAHGEAWHVGWRRAEQFRRLTSWRVQQAPPARALDTVVRESCGLPRPEVIPTRDSALETAVAWAPGRVPQVAFAHDMGTEARQFRVARELHDILFEGASDEPFARVASSFAPGALSRANAFAAELLAPASLVRSKLGGRRWLRRDEMHDLARELAVSPRIVEHQVENHQMAAIALE